MNHGVEAPMQVDPLGLQGHQVGRFTIQQAIGFGGVATVYRAFDEVRGHSVALKILHPDPDEATYTRFRREALKAGMLRHPHIVRIYQVGNTLHGGAAYIAMDLVEGESLGQLLQRRNRLPPLEACTVVEPIARALAFAHEADIVHRDVKPSNILLRNARPGLAHSINIESIEYPVVPLLSDFGIARFLDEPDLTFTGRTVGTPAYMAPEQCQGDRQVDGRTDIYALGTVLYRCVTGRLPFQGSMTQILHAHVYDAVKVDAQFAEEIPDSILEIIRHTLAKSPADRYDNASALADDLLAETHAAGEEITRWGESSDTLSMSLASLTTNTRSEQTITLVPGLRSSDETVEAIRNAESSTPANAHRWQVSVVVACLLLIAAGVGYVLGTFKADYTIDPRVVRQPPATTRATLVAVVEQGASGVNSDPILNSELHATSRANETQSKQPSVVGQEPSIAGPISTTGEIAAIAAVDRRLPAGNGVPGTDEPTRSPSQEVEVTPTYPALVEALPESGPLSVSTATPTASDVAAYLCNYVIDPMFVGIAQEIPDVDRAGFQCPTSAAAVTPAALLEFERGHMLRLDESAQIYVYYAQGKAWERLSYGGSPVYTPGVEPPVPSGLFVPAGDFGVVWGDARRNSALGFARTEEPVQFTATVQSFPGGVLVGHIELGRVFVYLLSRLRL